MHFDYEHIIIDGFNVVHAWQELKELLIKNKIDVSISRLIDYSRKIHDFYRTRTTVVFDGNGIKTEIQRNSPKERKFSVVFSRKSVSADEIIANIVDNSKNPKNVCVVTEDMILANRIRSANVISCSDFMEYANQTQIMQISKIKQHNKNVLYQWNKNQTIENFLKFKNEIK